jgi:TIR domain-containing protein
MSIRVMKATRDNVGASGRREALRAAALSPRRLAPDNPPANSGVFISYSRTDRPVAQALANDLSVAGISVWWDIELFAGQNFHDAIVAALNNAKAVIVIWSKAAAASSWVRDEAQKADRQNKLITTHVPNFDLIDVPLGFGQRHCDNVEDRAAIIRALGVHGVHPQDSLGSTDRQPRAARPRHG